MKITREVIYDLLPSYFSGDASPDTQALVEEFVATDPEFARMMNRFRSLYVAHPPPTGGHDGRDEKSALYRARTLMERRSQTFGGAIGFTLAAMFALALGAFGESPSLRPLVIGIVFGAVGVGSWISWYLTGRRLQRYA